MDRDRIIVANAGRVMIMYHYFTMLTIRHNALWDKIRRRRRQVFNRFVVQQRLLLSNIEQQCNQVFLNTLQCFGNFCTTLRSERSIWMKPRSRDFWNTTVLQHYTDADFVESFRMKKDTFKALCQILSPRLAPKIVVLQPREPLSVEKQLAIALYKLASCCEYRVVGNVFGVHKSTVKKCLYKVVDAINDVMLKDYISMPNEIEASDIANQFETISKIPQIIGCIDGSHIPILAPRDGFRDFVNRKGWPSYNLQAVVDNNCRFRDIFVKYPGNSHDAAVFKNSSLYKRHKDIIPQSTRNFHGVDIPYMILGDPAYPLLPWLMKGYTGNVTDMQESFNVYLNSARVVVEMAFGRLKARWRILLKRIDIHYTYAPKVISACCILHNFVECNKEDFMQSWLQQVQEAEIIFPQPRAHVDRVLDDLNATNVRTHLANHLAEHFPLRKTFYNI